MNKSREEQPNRKKKLLLITDLYPHRYNPVCGVFVKEHANELSKYYQVKVIATSFPYPLKTEHKQEKDIEITHIFFPSIKSIFVTSFITYPLFALPKVKNIIKSWNPDIIQVHDYHHIPELFWLKTWLDHTNFHIYLYLHNIRSHPDRLKGNRLIPFYRKTLSKAFRNWDHIFTVNPRLKDWILPYMPENKITVTGNGISPTPPIQPEELLFIRNLCIPDAYKIISVGNLLEAKGFGYLILAVYKLLQKGLNIQLVIVGEGKDHQRLTELIQNLNLSDRVLLTGAIENSILRNIYPLFDLFVLASYSETFGIVFLEAMYASLPVIGIKGEGIYGLFEEDKEALYAEPRNSEDLANKIEWLITHPEKAAAIAKAGQQKVREQFMLSDLIKKVREVYEQS
ncbi:MAG TPA: glycosyltransferase family 4 protein [Candidatus Syntrophosphaera sp.]|nr:glycosyltransferase family 4 protein [Candidatus Syntrophosphaera sp.]HRR98213.1 glycosyltransferase family 4 protein [Candidatus Syntrophosphaera sp.]HRU47371.1 glycosyltransferase family 4 protein [Candidatus Syntrophosphaera sp.]